VSYTSVLASGYSEADIDKAIEKSDGASSNSRYSRKVSASCQIAYNRRIVPEESERTTTMKTNGIVLAAAMLLSTSVHDASAQDAVRVLVSNGLKAAMEDLQPACERAIGRPLALAFNSTAALKAGIEAGDRFDATLITREAIDDLINQNMAAAGSRTELGRSPLVIGIRAGATRDDIRTSGALKRTLLQAKSITYPRDGASRAYLEKMFAELGIAADLESTIVLAPKALKLRRP
jgi:ABC-type molybdate transport system substrate-binding protein